MYSNFKVFIGLIPAVPRFQLYIDGQNSNILFVNANMYGLLGLNIDRLLLSDRTIKDGNVLCRATITQKYGSVIYSLSSTGITNLEFITHFCADNCRNFYSGHLEQLAVACPNLQQLSLFHNVHCLKRLQGLRAVATCCQRLEGLNILFISAEKVENCVQLWEILVDLQLTYLAIELCCLQCFVGDDQTTCRMQILHQNCLKMKALESFYGFQCTECFKNRQQLLSSSFPSLIHCITQYIDIGGVCERLRYLQYIGDDLSCFMSSAYRNLQQLCLMLDQMVLSDSCVNTISAHGGLVHVMLYVHLVNESGIDTLIENSPHLITCHVYIRTLEVWRISFNPKVFKSRLEKKYSNRKLFLCGSYRLIRERLDTHDEELWKLAIKQNTDLTSLWEWLIMTY